jgi:hypothetical protein
MTEEEKALIALKLMGVKCPGCGKKELQYTDDEDSHVYHALCNFCWSVWIPENCGEKAMAFCEALGIDPEEYAGRRF